MSVLVNQVGHIPESHPQKGILAFGDPSGPSYRVGGALRATPFGQF